ncbi:hypothetical protein D3C71_627030 [compost metagenome]
MKKVLFLCVTFISLFSFSQDWNAIGNPVGIANATEVDIEITPGGKLYAAYIDTDHSKKVSVVRWNAGNNSWEGIGNAGIGDANVFDLKLIILDEVFPVFAAKTFYQATNQALEIYKFDGTIWTSQTTGLGTTYNQIDHNSDYSLQGTSLGKWFLTFKNPYTASASYNRVITMNMSDQTLYGTASSYALLSASSGKLGSYVDENNAAVIHGQTGVTSNIHLDASSTSGVYSQNHTFEAGLLADNITKMQIERNNNLSAYAFIWASSASNYPLKFNSLSNSSLNTELVLSTGSAISDFELDTYNNDAYLFYKNAASCFYVKISNVTAPTVSTFSSGNTLAPATATSLKTQVYNGIYVIAYVDGGKFYVKEYNQAANIEDHSLFNMCESSVLNNPANNSVYCLDPNFSQQGLSMTCISQNVSIIPNSALSITGSGTLQFSITIGNTNDVSSPMIVDLQVELFDNGISCGTKLIPVTIYPKPDLAFTNTINAVCKNTDPINLNSWATPTGGIWSGTGILNNTLYPDYTTSSITAMNYTKTNQYGCTSSGTLPFTINQTPALNVTTTSSDCNLSTGTAAVTITSGQSPYSIYWSTGSTQSTTENLSPGQYVVSVTDANGCLSTASSMIGSNGLSQTGTVSGATCYGTNNGFIHVTTTGGAAPLVYSWSNGATTEDLSGLHSGPYELTITDALGCISAATYVVQEPQQIMLNQMAITQPSCSATNGQATASFIGGTAPFNYAWTDAQGTNLHVNNTTLSNIGAGTYFCTLTDANNCAFTSSALVSNNFGPNLIINTIIPSSCSNDGGIQLNVISGNPQSYLWTNGATTQNISNLAPGTYSVSVTGASGCITVLGATVGAALPPASEICLVTVDELTNKNLVVWEKPFTNGIDHFNIYRETSQAGLYQVVGSVDYNDESIFNDPVAAPNVRSWRYKITSVNACGVESELSSNHKTIHLVVNQGLGSDVNLFWDKYEGFNYPNFVLKRYTNTNGWETLATMPNNLFTYTDQPTSTNGLFYVVTVDAPSTCSSTKMAQDFNTTRSNRDNRFSTAQPNSLSEWIDQMISIYPNPAHSFLNVENTSNQTIEARVLDQTGRVISVLMLVPGQTKIDCGKLSVGMYNLELQSQGAKTLKRFMIEK